MYTPAFRKLGTIALLMAICGGFLSYSAVLADSDDDTDSPTCWIASEPLSVERGHKVTLRWDSKFADKAWISDIGDVDTHGMYEIANVQQSETYTLTVEGDGGTTTCSTTVSIKDAYSGMPSCSIYAVPNSISNGKSSTLHWDSSNAHNASLTSYGSVNLDGSRTVTPSQTTTYMLTVWNDRGQSGQCHTTVYVDNYGYPYYPHYNYTQVPSCVITLGGHTGYGLSRTANLSWRSSNATHAYLSNVGTVGLNGMQALLYPEIKNSYTLTVSGPGGTATCSTNGTYTGPQYPQYPGAYPYVSLSQIPYTGLDLGPVGTALYWLGMILLAGGLAYGIVRLRPNAFGIRN